MAEGHGVGNVTTEIARRLAPVALPPGVTVRFRGDAEGAQEAMSRLLDAAPIGVIVLLACLLLQFDSFARTGIVLLTVPLAAVGVVPGLLLSGKPFGFTALLGLLALTGIVVNNAIVLIERMDENLRAGRELREAVVDAVARRTRPIVLTTLTTVGGLLPLTTSGATLWPPMAWTIISGLLCGLPLSLLVVPALYGRMPRPRPRDGAARNPDSSTRAPAQQGG